MTDDPAPLSASILDDLATGGGGLPAVTALKAAQRAKRLLMLRHTVLAATERNHPDAAALDQAYELLSVADDRHHDAVETVLRHPLLGPWAMHAARGVQKGAAIDHRYLTWTAASALHQSGAECAAEIPLDHGRALFPGLGRIRLGDAAGASAVLRTGPRGSTISTNGTSITVPVDATAVAPGWRPLVRLATAPAGPVFVVDDVDPYRGTCGPTGDPVDDSEVPRWAAAVASAWWMLIERHAVAAEEVAATISLLVPLASPSGRGVSATSRHAFGAMGLSRPTHGREVAVALAHERQHAKLGAVLDVVALVDRAGDQLLAVPWRPDPRPVTAALQGAYAHLGVADFWRRQREVEVGELARRAEQEYTRWRDAVAQVAAALHTSGALTRVGTTFVERMRTTVLSWDSAAVA